MENVRRAIKWRDLKLKPSIHRGDFTAKVIDKENGFANRLISVVLQCMPPGAHNEKHKHQEAVVHVLRGRGHSVVDGERIEWEEGDTLYIAPGAWHQHWNDDPKQPAWHLLILPKPLLEYVQAVPLEASGGDFSEGPKDWTPALPWDGKR